MSETYTITRSKLPNRGPKPLGRNVHHDSRSRQFPFRPATPRRVHSVAHTRYVPILDQGNVGSCTGNAALGCLGTGIFYDTLRRRFEDSPTDEWDEGEAVEIYSAATAIDPWPGTYPDQDTGSDGLSVAKVCQSRNYISGYEHAFNLDAVLQALMERPLIIGINWYSDFFDPTPDGQIVTGPGDTLAGGHEVVVDGYDADNGMLLCANSWGTGWGRNGRFHMHRDLFKRLLAEDGDATVFTPLTLAPPEPEPPTPTPTDDDQALIFAKFASDIVPWTKKKYPMFGAARAQRVVRDYLDEMWRAEE